MLSLGNVVYYHSLLMQMASSVAVRGGEVEEWGIGLAVCAWILWGKGVGGVRRGHVCCLWGMLSVTAPCWSWWGALWRRGRGGGGVRYRAGGVCVYPLEQRGWGRSDLGGEDGVSLFATFAVSLYINY